MTDAPEIRNRAVAPQLLPVGALRQFGDPDPVSVRRCLLCQNIHGHLSQVHVGPQANSRRDAGFLQHILYDPKGQLMWSSLVGVEVVGNIHEHLINAVHMDVFRGNVFQIDLIDPDTVVDVKSHPRWRNDKVNPDVPVPVKYRLIIGRGRSIPSAVQLPYFLFHFKKPGSPGDSPLFQCRGHGQANGLVCPAFVCHHQVCCQRIQPPLPAFHRSIKGF